MQHASILIGPTISARIEVDDIPSYRNDIILSSYRIVTLMLHNKIRLNDTFGECVNHLKSE